MMIFKNLIRYGLAISKNIPLPTQIDYKIDPFRSVHLTIKNTM
jgi:hypothetical protein